jgi:hypothetical protein
MQRLQYHPLPSLDPVNKILTYLTITNKHCGPTCEQFERPRRGKIKTETLQTQKRPIQQCIRKEDECLFTAGGQGEDPLVGVKCFQPQQPRADGKTAPDPVFGEFGDEPW